jgi:CRP-like cAMP-binding protein
MVDHDKAVFDIGKLLASAGMGRRIMKFAPKEAFFSQGDPADSVFYLLEGQAKVTVVSATGKEATIGCSLRETLSAKVHLRRWRGCVYLLLRPSQRARL